MNPARPEGRSRSRPPRGALRSLAGGAAAFLTRCGDTGAPHPNILLVMTDGQQHSQTSCASDPLLQTPHIDRLADEGVRFSNALCINSLCAPGRASILAGCCSHVHGTRGNSEKADAVEQFDPGLPTFLQLPQQAGYRTGLAGKWHLRQQPRGFDEMTGTGFQHWPPHRVGPHREVPTDRYKLIEYHGEGGCRELFDLRKDRDDLRNLYGQPGHAGAVRGLQSEPVRLRQHCEGHGRNATGCRGPGRQFHMRLDG